MNTTTRRVWSLARCCAGPLGLSLTLAGSAIADPMRPLGAGSAPGPAASRAGPAGMPGFLGGIGGPAVPSPSGSAQGQASTVSGPAAPAPTSAAVPEAPRLVALRQDSQGEWHALYDGRWLRKGDRLSPAPTAGASATAAAPTSAAAPVRTRAPVDNVTTVAHIDSQGLRLRTGRQTEQVFLLPQLQPSVTPQAASAVSSTVSSRARATGTSRP